jgi:hypothetical protein
MSKKLLIFTLLILFLVPTITQAVIETGTGSNVTSTITPNNPRPGDIITIALDGYGFNIDKSYFKWENKGKESSSGVGKKSYSFQLGKLGDSTKINVSVNYGGRVIAEKSFYFEPADIDLIWESNSYIPPFYQGKARATAGSELKIQAIPYLITDKGVVEKSSDLTYTWRRDGTFLSGSSGKGRDLLIINTDPNDRQIKISLRINSPNSLSYVDKDFIINLDQPDLVFYEKKPLIGLDYLKAVIDDYELYEEEANFTAIPFFWPTGSISNLNYLWRVNGLESQNTNNLIVRQPDSGAGENNISLEVTERNGQTRSSNGQFNIQFGNNLLRLNNAN